MTNVIGINFSHARMFDGDNDPLLPPPDDARRIIKLVSNEYEAACAEIERAFLDCPDVGVYRYGSTLVRVVWDEVKVAGGRKEIAPRLHLITSPNLLLALSHVARFQKFSSQKGDYAECNPPDALCNAYLARGEWALPPILAVVTAPALRPDGSLITNPGYDEATGLVYEPRGVTFPEIPTSPTKDQARHALNLLAKPLRYYRFATPADRSVALSAVITATIRQALANAPMHAFDAPTAGSGKSNLVDYASVIATGRPTPVIGTGDERSSASVAELEKRLGSAMLAGDPIIALDNIEDQLYSQLLCQALTQKSVKVRVLGKSNNVVVPSTATIFANGNNLVIAGDLTRRTLTCRIHPSSPRPELIKYPFHPVNLAERARPLLVAAVLTVVRAYLTQPRRLSLPPLGSYEQWSRFVREPLIWLGEADPVEVMETTRASDPQLMRLTNLLTSWANVFGFDRRVFTRDIMRAAFARRPPPDDQEMTNPELYDALRSVATDTNGKISPETLGWYLRRSMDRKVTIDYQDQQLVVSVFQAQRSTQGAKWTLEVADGQTALPGADYFNDELPL